MKTLFFVFVFFILSIFLSATIINIPADQPTIQLGINVAVDGDTVLVQPGTYIENINYNGKNIVVASLFLTTQNTSYISQTVIDGNQDGIVVTFVNEELATAVLTGFTITNGTLGIGCGGSGPSLRYLIITNNSGSGLSCDKGSTPRLQNAIVANNSAFKGGGIECSTGSTLILENVTITNNCASFKGGGIYCDESNLIFDSENRCNIFQNSVLNSRGYGVDIYAYDCETINVIVDTFTVFTPTDYYASPINSFTFDILHSIQDSLINSDLYVSVDGDDDNTGTTADDPLKTIRCALSKIYADSLNQNTIYLAPGIYSTETTGEIFPIEWSNFVSLDGNIENETILDANNETGVMRLYYVTNASIKNITIRNSEGSYTSGIRLYHSHPNLENVTITDNHSGNGGGMNCYYSNPNLENVTIVNNSSGWGGGIYCSHSNPSLENVIIANNDASVSGGGIVCYESNPHLENVIIANNSADYGGGIHCQSNSNPSLTNVTIIGNSASIKGGGIRCLLSSCPSLQNVTITDNYASHGGGIHCQGNSNPSLTNVTIIGNSASFGGGIYCEESNLNFNIENRCSIYLNNVLNSRGYGVDIYTCDCDIIDVIVDTFTVFTPTDYYASPIDNFTFDILHSIQDSLINSDLYVSVDGDDSNTGTTADDPLKTIRCALSKIYADSLNQNTIFLLPGIYSSATNGEAFPIEWSNYVSLEGSIEEETILDGNNESRVIQFHYVTEAVLSNIIIRNGYAYKGGGIYCFESSPCLENVTITDNSASRWGGGIYCNSSDPSLLNVIITDNSASRSGGGIYFINSNPNLSNVTICGNTANIFGGGIHFYETEPIFDPENRCNIYLNFSSTFGNDLSGSRTDVIVDTFTVLNPTDYFAYPVNNFTFDILNCMVEPVNQDLYVSPAGSNNNSGLTPDDPLLTISYALVKIIPVSTDPGTIFLSDGTFSPSQTGEFFPLNCRSFISLNGASMNSAILDGEGMSRVLHCDNDNNFSIQDLTIRNGNGGEGGGIYFYQSSPSLENVTITNNSASVSGGGIHCFFYSCPSLTNVAITDNYASGIGSGGGGFCCSNSSSPSLTNVIITGNSASDNGGISCNNFSNPNLENVTITGNTAINGGGVSCRNSSDPVLMNCILWNNSPHEVYFNEAASPNTITISYSDIQGGEAAIITNDNGTVNWLEGNIDADPLFADTLYHLSSASPCIDAGNPDPIYYDPEDPYNPGYALYPAMGTIINDMGAYGGPNAIGWITVPVNDDVIIQPTLCKLYQNYPNPFNPSTTISFSLNTENTEDTEIIIYNIKGQKVKTLECNNQVIAKTTRLFYSINWNGRDSNGNQVGSGIYFYKLKSGNFEKIKKMILLK